MALLSRQHEKLHERPALMNVVELATHEPMSVPHQSAARSPTPSRTPWTHAEEQAVQPHGTIAATCMRAVLAYPMQALRDAVEKHGEKWSIIVDDPLFSRYEIRSLAFQKKTPCAAGYDAHFLLGRNLQGVQRAIHSKADVTSAISNVSTR